MGTQFLRIVELLLHAHEGLTHRASGKEGVQERVNQKLNFKILVLCSSSLICQWQKELGSRPSSWWAASALKGLALRASSFKIFVTPALNIIGRYKRGDVSALLQNEHVPLRL